ncbi:AfsR/SARP family transcriptional regulator [Streptomyces sp. UNOB3_S3]|uniref:AfsR/SARP family transcriptional regulator n=1 Tax=Streptomyces sp. UNOB3_S3 TaxID=2871682 RepID=UPI001E52CD4A|nr:AfsR/SARP family transcriptional regulator [Streptomyces sp. UNOB3_S3]MCC3776523.1 AfsR/SARP family transcriptional regulator [Streptomyces sp. UNOB3_S3]
MRFRLIGPFEIVTEDGVVRRAGTPKVSQTLALLLIRANEIVTTDSLIRELWRGDAPRSALNTVQTYIHHARKLLAQEGCDPLLTLRPGGYMMRVDPEAVDIKVFEGLVAQARADLRACRLESAEAALGRALDIWRGPLLVNVPTGDVLSSRIARLEDIRVRALELRIELWAALGRQRDAIAELRVLVHDYPLNESFHGQLISALHQAGRRAEALQAYRKMHRILWDELGLEPSGDVQRLHQEMLAAPPAAPQGAGGPARRATAGASRRPPQRTASLGGPPAPGLAWRRPCRPELAP